VLNPLAALSLATPGSRTGTAEDLIPPGEVLVFRLPTDEAGQFPYLHVLKATAASVRKDRRCGLGRSGRSSIET
jgi:hypothetical protein